MSALFTLFDFFRSANANASASQGRVYAYREHFSVEAQEVHFARVGTKKRDVDADRRIQSISFERQSGLPITSNQYCQPSSARAKKYASTTCGGNTHIKSLNNAIPNNIRPDPSFALHDAVVINGDAPRPKTTTSLRVRVRCMIF